jgi:biotin-dependent carboxylase-like uncharacterized protein
MIEITKPGLLTTVQDLGRPGFAHLGVPRSGALDAPALQLANRLAGNSGCAAGLETTMRGCAFRTHVSTVVAVTGAPTEVRVDGSLAPFCAPLVLAPGSTVEIKPPRTGVRSYVAFAGGIVVPEVLGSRATDTLSGIGPTPLRAGDQLPLGDTWADPTILDTVRDRRTRWDEITLAISLGPRDDWFTDEAIGTLLGNAYALSTKSNRVGARLTGPSLTRAVAGELPSEGIVLGAVQVPADGQPLVFLADHPTTGGYPVVGIVDAADLPLLAQARPGAAVRFRQTGGHGPQR